MKKCAFLTMDDLQGLECYDHLVIPHLTSLGWQTEEISWRSNSNWSDYDAVIIRSTWDYQNFEREFLHVLDEIERSDTILLNSIQTVKWNVNKAYLKELESQGVVITPTKWCNHFDLKDVSSSFEYFNTDEIVIKPCVSAGSFDTFRLTRERLKEKSNDLVVLFDNREFMVQPFIKEVVDHGEYSLFFFNNELSHTILKTPKKGDFRVQEEFGGHLSLIEPPIDLEVAAKRAIDLIKPKPLYVRVDMVKYQDDYALMELELIEPSLYFNMDKAAAKRFADAIHSRLT